MNSRPADVVFIDANRSDVTEIAPLQPPAHDPIHRTVDGVPTGGEDFGGFCPTKPSRPFGEEDLVAGGEAAFAFGPGNGFDFDSAIWALDAAHVVAKEDFEAPQRDVFEIARLSFTVVTRSWPVAATANWFTVLARSNIDNDAVLSAALSKGKIGEDKGLEFIDSVEKSFDEQCNGRINGVMAVSTPHPPPSRNFPGPGRKGRFSGFYAVLQPIQPNPALANQDQDAAVRTHCSSAVLSKSPPPGPAFCCGIT